MSLPRTQICAIAVFCRARGARKSRETMNKCHGQGQEFQARFPPEDSALGGMFRLCRV